jgi:hypothetical protein
MGIQLRVGLPDRPGALARVAQAIARTGADVVSVSVLESEGGRAIDDFRIRWPDGKDAHELVASVEACQGVSVIGCRRSHWLLDGRADLDLIACLLAAPERRLQTLVDMAPAALDADWAELRPPARRLPAIFRSSPQPHDERAADSMPVRPRAHEDDAGAWAYFPLTTFHSLLVIGRDGGPGFLRSEVVHAQRVLDLATRTLERIAAAPVGAESSFRQQSVSAPA